MRFDDAAAHAAAHTSVDASVPGADMSSAGVPAAGQTVFHAPARERACSGHRATVIGVAVSAFVLLALVVIGLALESKAAATDFSHQLLAPSLVHPFGTDWMGRDMLARTLAGLSTSIVVGVIAAVVSSVIALVLATIAALGGPRADALVGWLIDLVMGIPHLVLLLLISYALGRGTLGVVVGVSLTHWPSLARVLRAEILQMRVQPYIEHARALGISPVRIARTHALRHVLPQYLVGLVLLFPHAVLHEASITFLGFGLSLEQPAIGVILSEAMGYLTAGAWWLAVFPGLALLAVVLLFDRVGATLRRLVTVEGVQA